MLVEEAGHLRWLHMPPRARKKKQAWWQLDDGMSELLPTMDRVGLDDPYGVVAGRIWGSLEKGCWR